MTDQFNSKQETTLRDFVNVLFRRKWLILTVVGFAAVLVVFLQARKPVIWESSSRILVRRGEQGNHFTNAVRYLGWAEEASSQIQMILSDEVFTKAKKRFDDAVEQDGLPENWVFNPGAVRSDVVGESNAFVITYFDLNPDVVKLGCESMTFAFRDYYRERKAPPELAVFFEDEIRATNEELTAWRERRQAFLNETKFFGSLETNRFYLGKVSRLESRLSVVKVEIAAQELRIANLVELSKKTGPELEHELAFTVGRNLMQTGIVQKIKLSLQTLNMRREDLAHKYTDIHPEMVAVNNQIRDLHSDLKQEILNGLKVEQVARAANESQREQLMGELAEAEQQLTLVPDRDRELTEIDNMIDELEKKYDRLLSRQGDSAIAIASRPDWEVAVLSNASAPYSRKRSDYVRLALGPLLALIVGLGIAFFLESLDHSVRNSAEAEELLATPVLATISEFGQQREERTVGG